MVDPSLLRQAADRGVTICFADLDGAEGLWVPEERTIMVSRGLSDAKVAEVIEHELTHVAIDDQHADLDAGRDVVVGRPPARRTSPWSVVLAAAASVAVVVGIVVGLAKAGVGSREQVVLPKPTGGLTASESADGAVPVPGTTVIVTRDAAGRVVTRTVVLTPSVSPSLSVSPSAGSLTPTPTPRPTVARTSAPPPAGGVTATPTPPPSPSVVTASATPVVTTDPPVVPTAVPTGTGAGVPGEGGGAGDTAGDPVGDAAGTSGGALGDAPSEDAAGTATAITTVGPTITSAG